MKRSTAAAALAILALTFSLSAQSATAAPVIVHAKAFSNCTQLNKTYHHGVGKSGARDHVAKSGHPVKNFTKNTAVYNQNKGKDRDHDGIACEKK